MLGNAPPTHTNPDLVIDALSKDTLQLLECESSNLIGTVESAKDFPTKISRILNTIRIPKQRPLFRWPTKTKI